MESVDVVVVGGGIVGLSAAYMVAGRGHSTCVLEGKPRPGLEASTHKSGIIHAGIYYTSDSLKARLCVEGREQLYAFCESHAVPHARCGKLIVAHNDSDIPALEKLLARGHANGVTDLSLVDRAFIRQREPHVESPAAIWSPSTGIIEAESFVRTLTHLARSQDASILPESPVMNGEATSGGIELRTPHETIMAQTVVNAAGLHADELSASLGGETFIIYPVRGEYAELVPAARHLVNGPIYPLPDPSGYSPEVHLTRTTWGSVMLGPTSQYQATKDDYESGRFPLKKFYESACRLLPTITLADLRPGGTGIRATASPPDQPFADFLIKHDACVPGLIQAAGIDSPGLTASLAIGAMVADLVDEALG